MTRVSAAIAAGLLAAAGAHRALAQDEGPIVIGAEAPKFRFLDISRPELTLGLVSQYSDNSSKGSGGDELKSTTTFFQETLGGTTEGYLVSPHFFSFNLAGTFGLSQAETKSSGSGTDTNERSDGRIYEYDLSGTLRQYSDLPVSAFARRTETYTNRTFGATYRSILENYGGEIDYRSKTLPSSLRVYRLDQTQSALTGEQDFVLNQDALEWHTEWHPSDRQFASLDYRLLDIEQNTGDINTPIQTTSFRTQELNLTHNFQFGRDHQSSLNSNVNYSNQTGDFAQKRLMLDERLQLQHTPNFQTNYGYRYDDSDYGGAEQTRNEVKAGFRHKLFQSLVTTGNVGAIFLDQGEGATTDEQYGNLDFEYTKKIPLGKLTLNLDGAFDRQQNDANSQPIQVLNQAHTFVDSQPIVIIQPFLNANSIRLTNATGTFTYDKGTQYTVIPISGGVQIFRVPGGLIDPDTPVLVNYELLPQASSDVDTNTFSFGSRYDVLEGTLKGLGVYGRYLMQDQTISSDNPAAFTPDNIRDYTLGADYRFWKMVLSAEYQNHDSSVSPYQATRLNAQYVDRIGSRTTLTLGTQYQILNYSGESGNAIDILTLSGNLTHYFSRELWGTVNATWLQESTSLQGDTTGTDVTVELHWKHRQTEVYGELRHTTLNTDDEDTSFMLMQVTIERKF